MMPDGTNIDVKVTDVEDDMHNPMESAPHPKQKVYFKVQDNNGNAYIPADNCILRRQE